MGHHGREDELPEPCGAECSRTALTLRDAVKLIERLALSGDGSTTALHMAQKCNDWLKERGMKHGDALFERVRNEERRAELDRRIEALKAERDSL